MRPSIISIFVLGASVCIYACGGSTTPLLTATGGAGGATMTGGNRGPGAFGDGITYGGGGSAEIGFGGTTGGTPTTGPIGSGGIDSDMCSGRYGQGLNCGGTTSGGYGGGSGFGGSVVAPVDGSTATSMIINVEIGWGGGMDAGAKSYNATIKPDGTATCHERSNQNGWRLLGQTEQPDQELRSLLARPDLDATLSTTCLLAVADVEPPITTTLADGSEVQHLNFGSCATTALGELRTAIQRVCSSANLAPDRTDAAGDGSSRCSCNGDTTTWDCFCAVYDCNKTLDNYKPTGGPTANYGAWAEYAGCNLIVVEDYYALEPFREVFDAHTGKLVGKAAGKLFGMGCPFGGVDANMVMLRAGTFPGPACVRTKCIEGHGIDDCMPGVDAGARKD